MFYMSALRASQFMSSIQILFHTSQCTIVYIFKYMVYIIYKPEAIAAKSLNRSVKVFLWYFLQYVQSCVVSTHNELFFCGFIEGFANQLNWCTAPPPVLEREIRVCR